MQNFSIFGAMEGIRFDFKKFELVLNLEENPSDRVGPTRQHLRPDRTPALFGLWPPRFAVACHFTHHPYPCAEALWEGSLLPFHLLIAVFTPAFAHARSLLTLFSAAWLAIEHHQLPLTITVRA
jgi:hypothetical protein